ncbi:MAG: transglutaminase domain-containing protein [Gammaproteobacteria bacterium]|nr:transglutaminase domain-containing protein [Gammaproteobacteria bacterium]NIR82687.1 transglutaminase domain-containing protein [Gammaproteobacteria bacterium]NIR89394.1 transglutaminase domain-containing protein [Gammaproteobacteria bacterium]NIU03835.1 transglutaminase domain-containing protein [Gammaproteobacteria bacterium]NIV51169.1 hypothetical protein [Gammaproteobacteria bacterium]
MTFPPLLLGGAVLFWGWHVQMLLFAVPMALALEGSRFVGWRWELSDKEFNLLADASAAAFLLVVIYLFYAHSFRGVYVILEHLPFVLFFLTAAQLYSTRARTKLSALLLGVRRAEAKGQISDAGSVDVTWPFWVICLVAASAGAEDPRVYYTGLCGLVGWALWAGRCSPRYPLWVWAMACTVAMSGGVVAQLGVLELRAAMEPMIMNWFHERWWRHRDPYRAQMRLGHIGRLKTSGRIVMRVRTDSAGDVPRLLREASYQTFSGNIWMAGDTTFTGVESNDAGVTWRMHDPEGDVRSALISAYLHDGRGLLAVPNGTFEIDELLVDSVSTNPLGAVKVREGPDLIEYRVRYGAGASFDAAPSGADLSIPRHYRRLLEGTAARLGLLELTPARKLERLAAYFRDNFRYSLAAGERAAYTPLRHFLERSRAGHCEYFATATVLLLRAAGLPARYATGYAVDEYSPLERQYVVRRRHAHSWALVYVDGRWRDFDTTPPVWSAREAGEAGWWQPGYDLWAWALYEYQRWRLSDSEGPGRRALLLAALPLLAFLVWRLRSRARVRRAGAPHAPAAGAIQRRGADSELYLIERHLARAGFERPAGETLLRWTERHARAGTLPGAAALGGVILPLHYRYRFDPGGLDEAGRTRLREAVRAWLTRHAGNA